MRSNWHWYLKQELRFPASKGLSLLWSEEGPNILQILTAEGQLRQVGFCQLIAAAFSWPGYLPPTANSVSTAFAPATVYTSHKANS